MISTLTYSTTPVTTSAYVELNSSLASSFGHLEIVDTSQQLMKLAMGVSGSEVDLCTFAGNGVPVIINGYFPVGTRLSVKAISGQASLGYLTVSYLA